MYMALKEISVDAQIEILLERCTSKPFNLQKKNDLTLATL
jgi:hypothetical protein